MAEDYKNVVVDESVDENDIPEPFVEQPDDVAEIEVIEYN